MIKFEYDKHLMIVTLVLIILALIFTYGVGNASAADSGTIYVNATSGNDDWNGQSATYQPSTNNGPKLTIQNATGTISANGTIDIANGIYAGVKNNNITINKNMTIQGQSQSGTIINGSGINWIFKIPRGMAVKIINITLINGNTAKGSAIENDGTLTVINCTFSNNTADNGDGGAIYNDGTLTDINNIFYYNTANYGGAIYNGGYLTLNKVTLASNAVTSITSCGGAVYNIGNVDFNSCTLTSNSASSFRGGAIYSSAGTLTLYNSSFVINIAQRGGGLCIYGGFVNMTYCTFTDNVAFGDYGGAIFGDSSVSDSAIPISVVGSTFNGNNAPDGGAIMITGVQLTVDSTSFQSNYVLGNFPLGYGGAIHAWNCIVTIQNDTTFTDNAATSGGGAFCNDSGNIGSISGGSFTDNTAQGNNPLAYGNGGAIFTLYGSHSATLTVNNTYLSINGTTFSGNTALNGDIGGGAIRQMSGTLTLTNCEFDNNEATNGGAIYNENGSLTETYSTFKNNSATDHGGAIYNSPNATSIVDFGQIIGNTAKSGSSIYNLNGTVDAILNWWGSNNSPIENVFGNVTLAPWYVKIVSSVNPANNAVYVHTNNIIVTFSEPIKSGNMWIELESSSGTLIPITTSINGTVLTITLNKILNNDTRYALTLHTGSLTDLAGNPLALWGSSFSVGPSPKITSTNPLNDALNVVTNKMIIITFNEPIKAGNIWIELKNSAKAGIPFTETIYGNTITITPSTLLSKGVKYIVTIHTGSVTDLAGNPVSLFSIIFTTTK